MTFTAQDADLYYDGKIIFTAPSSILKTVTDVFRDQVLVLYDARQLAPDVGGDFFNPPSMTDPDMIELVNRNIFLIDKIGNVVWRIQTHETAPHPFASITIDSSGVWYAAIGSGYLYKVDPQTGATHSPIYTK